MAIGSCVTAYIGRLMLRKAIEYSGGISPLVYQDFFSSKWIGVGTSLFAESSFRPVTKDQLTMQQKKVKAFGLLLDNPKLLENP